MEWGKKINSYKMLSVMDHTGRYIFLLLCLGRNDREVFTGSPLYLREGEFFSDNQWISSDGAFEGMVDLFAHTRIQEMIWIRFVTTLHSVKSGKELRIVMVELECGFPYWGTIKKNYLTLRKFCF